MKVNMNGIKVNLARAYNGLFEPTWGEDQLMVSRDRLEELRYMVGAILCLETEDENEMRCLFDDIPLKDAYTGKWPEEGDGDV